MHWYHHALTFLYAQITYTETQAWCRWSLALNLTVHTIMYSYFGVQALKIKTPRYVAKFITTIQITQFVISCYIFSHLVYIKFTNSVPNCAASWNVLSLGALMYLSYLYLFASFFYKAYIRPSAAASAVKSKKVQVFCESIIYNGVVNTSYTTGNIFQTWVPPTFDHTRFLQILTAEKFPEQEAKQWVNDHFYLTLQISTVYVLVIFGTNIMGTIRLTPEFFDTLINSSFRDSYCKVSTFTSGLNGYWVWLFIVSKMFEALMFLHWYHHILTMIYAFYSYPLSPGFNRWGIYLNFFVHAFMYSYYFLRSMKIKVPGSVAKFITTIQIWQFIISVVILIHLGNLIFIKKVECDFDPRVFAFAVFMDITYLVLFINFFLKAYVLKGGSVRYKAVPATANGKPVDSKANGKANGVSNGTATHIN
uniref:Elongation of very long chain fatty acids protein n=1 Tax=Ditylenchus dipsaci TaxID=166011 RepID=A0A915E021_9BILA